MISNTCKTVSSPTKERISGQIFAHSGSPSRHPHPPTSKVSIKRIGDELWHDCLRKAKPESSMNTGL
jgi:hypothetical protein